MKLSKKRLERLLDLAWVGFHHDPGGGLDSDSRLLDDARRALLGPAPKERTPAQKGRASREKGQRRERQWNLFLREEGLFPEAKRGWQARGGGAEEPDSANTHPYHFETKGGEYASPYASLEQAWRDAVARHGLEALESGEVIVAVPHKRSNRPWLIFHYAKQWAQVLRRSDLLDQGGEVVGVGEEIPKAWMGGPMDSLDGS